MQAHDSNYQKTVTIPSQIERKEAKLDNIHPIMYNPTNPDSVFPKRITYHRPSITLYTMSGKQVAYNYL